MDIVSLKLSELHPYENNPRQNDDAVDAVAASIKEFGFKVPIVVDKNNVIVAGHTRYKAAKKLKLKTVPCVVADDLSEGVADNPYTTETTIPQYEPTGECPDLSALYDTAKTDDLIAEIEASKLRPDEKGFLLRAAGRHTVFNYRKIAEYYAHASPEMQELMEKSALVIIDEDDAIRNGFVALSSKVSELMEE